MKPAIILIDPQLGENIGMVARAMWNCSLTDLRLVRPRDHWLNEHTLKAAAGASDRLNETKVFATTQEAIADLHWVFATTARPRCMEKIINTPKEAADYMVQNPTLKTGILFGRERSGLHNDDIAMANVVIEIPMNPDYSSLNLAQAALICAYEYHQAWLQDSHSLKERILKKDPALKENIILFFEHLERELDKTDFLLPLEKRAKMVRNLRNIFQHIPMSEQDVRTLRGIISALTFKPGSPYKGFDNKG
jgi:tRNA/rRNA methyltransferase